MYSILALVLFLAACGGFRVTRSSFGSAYQHENLFCALYRSRVSEIRLSVVSEVRPQSGGGNEFFGEEESEIESILKKNLLGCHYEGSNGDDTESRWVRFPTFQGTSNSVRIPSCEGEVIQNDSQMNNILQSLESSDYAYDDLDVDARTFVHSHLGDDAKEMGGGSSGGKEVAVAEDSNDTLRKKKASKQALTNYNKRRSLLKMIKDHVHNNRISKVLNCLRDKTGDLSRVEINYLASDTIRCLGASGAGMARHCTDILQLMYGMDVSPDIYTLTAAMSVLNKYRLHTEVLRIFDSVRGRGQALAGEGARAIEEGHELDAKFFENGVRAAGHEWEWKRVLAVLDEAHAILGGGVLPVVHSAMTNLKYSDSDRDATDRRDGHDHDHGQTTTTTMDRVFALLQWLERRGLRPEAKTIDACLAVACAHGTASESEKILQLMSTAGLRPTHFTFNTVLDRCAAHNHVDGAVHTLEAMRRAGLRPDGTTYNTLLKLCVRRDDMHCAKAIVSIMQRREMSLTDYAKSSMMRLWSSHGDVESAMDIIHSESNSSVTGPMFASAIKALGQDWQQAVRLLQRANHLGIADEPIFAAAAQSCFAARQFEAGLRLYNAFFQKGFRMNKYMLSIVVSACLDYMALGAHTEAEHYLDKYLALVQSKHPRLLTDSLCQRLTRELTALQRPELAASLHLKYLAHATCSSEVLLALFVALHRHLPSDLAPSRQAPAPAPAQALKQTARLALALVGVYVNPSERSDNATDGDGSPRSPVSITRLNRRKQLIRTSHLNRLLRILSEAGMYPEAIRVFHLMRSSTSVANRAPDGGVDVDVDGDGDGDDGDGTGSPKVLARLAWRPTTFTIAEVVRAAKLAEQPEAVVEVMQWGLREAVLLPEGVISDALSYLFSLGRTDIVLELYESLYDAGKVNHWSNRDAFELDLHDYSRGMAYAAISVALQEARDIVEAMLNAGEEDAVTALPEVLTVITGRSEGRKGADAGREPNGDAKNGYTKKLGNKVGISAGSGGDGGGGYVLSDEVQNVLIESFFPPIPSSTVPNNAGRLLVPYRHQKEGDEEEEEKGS